jgi:hypothetical protein
VGTLGGDISDHSRLAVILDICLDPQQSPHCGVASIGSHQQAGCEVTVLSILAQGYAHLRGLKFHPLEMRRAEEIHLICRGEMR